MSLKEEVAEIKDTLYGPSRDDGIVVEVKVLMQVYRDTKKIGLGVLTAILANLALTILAVLYAFGGLQ